MARTFPSLPAEVLSSLPYETNPRQDNATAKPDGWNSEVLEKIGVGWPPKSGWIRRIVDSDIPDTTYEECLRIKDSHLKPKTIERLLNKTRNTVSDNH